MRMQKYNNFLKNANILQKKHTEMHFLPLFIRLTCVFGHFVCKNAKYFVSLQSHTCVGQVNLFRMDITQQIRQPIAEAFHAYESLYEQTMRSDNALLDQVLRYISAKRGKQLRPMLVLLSANLCRNVSDKSLRAAVALEMLHNASLVHDDVVDSSPMRRGVPSVQEKWTNKVAVLVGDWMLAKMISIVGEIRNAQILAIVSEMARALSSGELIQLHAGSSMWISEEQYFEIIGKKTAELFAACTEAGGRVSRLHHTSADCHAHLRLRTRADLPTQGRCA